MMVLIDERDRTATKLNRLTRENHQATHNVCKEELDRAERERDEAVGQNQRLEEQLRANARLHGETRQDLSSRPPQPPVPRDGGSVLGTDAGQEPLMSRLQHLSRQQQDLEHQLQVSLQAEREASTKINRLERLVEVLRKKVGTGNLRPVI